MIDEHINNPKSAKFYVKRYLQAISDELKNKTVIDMPAGNGATTEILKELGCSVEPYDLFPEYFLLEGIECKRANIADRIPVEDGHADYVVCQEGIEHFSDQLKAFKEFARVLKNGGKLILTTPSYSNLKSKFSYLLFESEYFNKFMPPNEIDSIWMSDQSIGSEIYHGHIFMVGIQRLRILAKLSGMHISKVLYMRTNKTSLVLFPLFYPFILLSSWMTYTKAMRKNRDIPKEVKKKTYREQLSLNINPRILLDSHTFIVFEKEKEMKEVYSDLSSIFRPFGQIM